MAKFDYDQLKFLGEGYFAHAYLLDDGNVIKVGRFGDQEVAAMQSLAGTGLAPELLFQGRTTHPERGRCEYIIMGRAPGVPVSSVYEEGTLMSVPLARAYGHGLRALHNAGWVHGDPHPNNTFVTYDDTGEPTITFIDLGLAQVYSADLAARKDLSERYWKIWSTVESRRLMLMFYE